MSLNPDRFRIAGAPVLSASFLGPRQRHARLPWVASTTQSYLFFWARNAIYHSLRALKISVGDRVLVPSYVCAAAVEPILAWGADPVFYEVRPDCLADLSDLESKIDGRTKALLAVHYFGFPQAIAACRDLCDRHGLALIEDCAHVLRGELAGRPLGTFGDASVFSWRKFLPLYDGGELILRSGNGQFEMNWRRESPLFTLRAAKNLFDQMIEQEPRHTILRTLSGWLQSSGRVLRRAVRSPDGQMKALAVENNTVSFVREMVDFPMSRVSRLILDHSNLPKIVSKRTANYLYLQEKLSGIKGVRLLFPCLPEGVCPWVLPFFFEGMPNGHWPLRELGVPAVTWGGVRHPAISKTDFPGANFLYDNLVFLPVHQGLECADLDFIVESVRVVRENGPALAHEVHAMAAEGSTMRPEGLPS